MNSIDLGGSIPTKIIEWKLPQQLRWVRDMQESLQRKGKVVDAEIRMAMAARMMRPEAIHRYLNEEQQRFVEQCSEACLQILGFGLFGVFSDPLGMQINCD